MVAGTWKRLTFTPISMQAFVQGQEHICAAEQAIEEFRGQHTKTEHIRNMLGKENFDTLWLLIS